LKDYSVLKRLDVNGRIIIRGVGRRLSFFKAPEFLNINCIVLAGGKGQRLGSDKVLETIGDESLIRRTITTLRRFQGDIIVVVNIARFDLGLDSLPRIRFAIDTYPGKGPLSGIHGGLKHSSSPYNIVVACDMPFLNVDLLGYMAGQANGYDAVVAQLEGGLEPLQAVYGKSCLQAIEEMFAENDFQTNNLFARINTSFIKTAELDSFDPQHLSFFNINTKSDINRAREIARN
jgi:molybdopterin-guanine dinucleotide biosynthesis protein A